MIFLHFGGFQAFGGVPGGDFDMQNPNPKSHRGRKMRKTNYLSVIWGGYMIYVVAVVVAAAVVVGLDHQLSCR